MDDKHVQEWGGVLPAPPSPICFFYIEFISLPGRFMSSLSPVILFTSSCSACAGFTSLENMSFDKATKTTIVK